MNKITLRKFPFPYKCALAICSDLDATGNISRYLELQKFLCTKNITKAGEGINLEIGNSFWFFRNSDTPGISYFDNLSNKETESASILRELIRTGFIDVLHTYGDFNKGGFERRYAELAHNEIKKRDFKIYTWVNHGNKLNSQNIGSLKWFLGDDEISSSYHMDIIKDIGINYFWISQLTHLVGQEAKFTVNNFFKNQIQKGLALKYWGKQIDPFFSNKLLEEVKLRDSSTIKAFMRFINPWGKYSYTDINNLPYQLNKKILSELIDNNGFMILYTHLGNNARDNTLIPTEAKNCLINLANEYNNGNIFITTTTRLLNYYETVTKLKYRVAVHNNFCEIIIEEPKGRPFEELLQGITFYTNEPGKTMLKFQDETLKTQINTKDFTGRLSISVPWQRLEFPA